VPIARARQRYTCTLERDRWKAGKAHGAFPMTIRPQRPPTGSRPRSATPNKSPALSRPPPLSLSLSLSLSLLRFPPLSVRPFETISSSGLINPTDGIGVRYQLKMMKPNGADALARSLVRGAARRELKLIPQPPSPLGRNKLKRLGIPRRK